MDEVKDINHPDIKEFISLKDNPLKGDQLVVIESDKVIKRIAPMGIRIYKLFCTKAFFDKNNNFIQTYIEDETKILITTPELMKEIVGYRVHQGVMALTDRPKSLAINKLAPPFLIINGITSQENIGTIIRNACAFGINSIIVDNYSCTPWHKRCIRVSLGNVFDVNLHHTNNLMDTLHELKKNNIQIIGTTANSPTKLLNQFKFNKNIAIILGSEGEGIQSDIRKECDELLKIPIKNKVSSVNVACASSIIFNKIYEQLN